MNTKKLPILPPDFDFETRPILKQLSRSHRYLAQLNGAVSTIPNEAILINTLALQEAKDSSEIESIITTHDELFKSTLFERNALNPSTKEVRNYASALKTGFQKVKKKELLTVNMMIEIYQTIEGNNGALRNQAGTKLINDQTGEVVYTPPQEPQEIIDLMTNLEKYINDGSISDIDDLTKMAIIHYQFESIHPFTDGNGRTGRIINILYLVLQGLLDIPILYLSRYIIKNKQEYYHLLQSVNNSASWEEWVLYMLKGIEETAIHALNLIKKIKVLMQTYKHQIREELPKIYSQDLLNNLFKHPYTKIEYVMDDMKVSRPTASKYLNNLVKKGFLSKQSLGRQNYYINEPLYQLFIE